MTDELTKTLATDLGDDRAFRASLAELYGVDFDFGKGKAKEAIPEYSAEIIKWAEKRKDYLLRVAPWNADHFDNLTPNEVAHWWADMDVHRIQWLEEVHPHRVNSYRASMERRDIDVCYQM
jgi:hypothetical protein